MNYYKTVHFLDISFISKSCNKLHTKNDILMVNFLNYNVLLDKFCLANPFDKKRLNKTFSFCKCNT